MIDPIPEPYCWPPTVELRRDPASVARHLAALRSVVASEVPTPARSGRGIVYVGGGRYWPGIVAGVRLLREVGCTLPVEVWYRGSCERIDESQICGLDVSLWDADHMGRRNGDNRVPTGNVYLGGWEAKIYALSHTRFEQVLFLDADAYAVADPTPLFDPLTPSEPFAFWSDLPRMETTVDWPRVWPTGGMFLSPTVQGGQFLIDTRHAARLLNVAQWMNQHSDYYYAWMFGDQDAWRVGLAARLCGYTCLGPADWRDVAFVSSHRGHPYIVHRCGAKLFRRTDRRPLERATEPNYALPLETRVFDIFTEVTA